jgi:hypothetical protein
MSNLIIAFRYFANAPSKLDFLQTPATSRSWHDNGVKTSQKKKRNKSFRFLSHNKYWPPALQHRPVNATPENNPLTVRVTWHTNTLHGKSTASFNIQQLVHTTAKGAQTPWVRSTGRLRFVPWCMVLVGPLLHVTFSAPRILIFFKKFVYPWQEIIFKITVTYTKVRLQVESPTRCATESLNRTSDSHISFPATTITLRNIVLCTSPLFWDTPKHKKRDCLWLARKSDGEQKSLRSSGVTHDGFGKTE